MTGEAVFSVGDATTIFQLELAGDNATAIDKRGSGTIELHGTNTCSGSIVVSSGRILFECDRSFGVVPESLKADAIVLKAASIGNIYGERSEVISANRGITLFGEKAYLFGRGNGLGSGTGIDVQSPITGSADLHIVRQTGEVRLSNPANSFTGTLVLDSLENIAFTGDAGKGILVFGADNVLPQTCKIKLGNAKGYLALNGTTQRVDTIDAGGKTLNLSGGGLFAYNQGTEAVEVKAALGGTDLAFLGTGDVTPNPITSHSPASIHLGANTLDISVNPPSSLVGFVLDGTEVVAGNATQIGNPIHLKSDSALTVGNDITMTGSLTSDGDCTLACTGGNILYGNANGYAVLQGTLQVAEENTITLTNNVWLSAANASYIIPSNAYVAGPGVAAHEGNQTFDNRHVVITENWGDGTAEVTVSNTSKFIIDATDGETVPVQNPDYTITAGYAVTLDSTSILQFRGAGEVVFNGSVAGDGIVRANAGGSVTFDAAALTGFAGTIENSHATMAFGNGSSIANDISATEGVIDVPEGETVTLTGTVSGTLRKTGAGTLVFGGSQENNLSLAIAEGRVNLQGTAQQIKEVTVLTNAVLAITGGGGNQIGDDVGGVTLDGGVFDLNGHVETVFQVQSRNPDSVVRNSGGDAMLSIGNSGSWYVGKIDGSAGKISLKGTSVFGVFGTREAIDVKDVELIGNGSFLAYTQMKNFKFVFTRDAEAAKDKCIALGEIIFTYEGVPIKTRPTEVVVSSCYNTTDYYGGKLIDGRPGTQWRSKNGDTNVTVTVSFGSYVKVDGYRFVISTLEPHSDPKDWDLYIERANEIWFHADSRRDQKLCYSGTNSSTYNKRGDWSGNSTETFTFNQTVALPADDILDETEVKLASAGSVYRLSNVNPVDVRSVSGIGTVRLEGSSVLRAGDLSGFAGEFTTKDNGETIPGVALNSRTGADEQPVRAKNAPFDICNATTDSVSWLIDDSYADGTVRGRARDGAGPLGIVKRGDGERTLLTTSPENTGTTRIEAGTLRVAGNRPKTDSVKYVRFRPYKFQGTGGSGYPFSMNEFQFVKNGAVMAWPAGTVVSSSFNSSHPESTPARLIDGDPSTRVIFYEKSNPVDLDKLMITFSFPQPVSFDSYQYYTGADGRGENASPNYDRDRRPTSWSLEMSDDGQTWYEIDFRENTPDEGSLNKPYLRGPYDLSANRADASGTNLPDAFKTAPDAAGLKAGAVKSRYFKLEVLTVQNHDSEMWGYSGWQLAEIALMRNGEEIPWPSDRIITGDGVYRVEVTGLADNDTNNRGYSSFVPNSLVIDTQTEVEFDAYKFYPVLGSNYFTCRVPRDWRLHVSTNGTDWVLLDEQTNYELEFGADKLQKPQMVSLANKFAFTGSTASDALSDMSPISIAEGAALKVASSAECVGPVSGKGTVVLNSSALMVNQFADTLFEGSISGSGSLVKTGANTLDLTGATLSGVNEISLENGVVTSTGKKIALAADGAKVNFNGGALSAEFLTAGALTVTGAVRYAVPADFGKSYSKTVFTYGSIDAGTKALLEGGEICATVGRDKIARVIVTETSCTVKISPSGLVITFR